VKSIVCFGEALIDFLADPTSDPHGARVFHQHAGGAPANVAAAVARLGGKSEFVGMFGRDMFGDFLIERLHAAGVSTRYAHRTAAAKTALAFVALDALGERSFSFYRPPAADLLFRDDHFDPACFADAGIFHVCSNSLTDETIAHTTLSGMARARAAGALISMDMNLRPSLWPRDADPLPPLWQALRAADVVKLAGEELAYLAAHGTGEGAALQRLLASARVVVVTDGAESLRWFGRKLRGELPALRVPVVDTTAAGDAFVGGMLFELAERGVTATNLEHLLADETAWSQVLRFASACGALTVTRQGAFAAMPTFAEVQALLAKQPQAMLQAHG
jgi:fructokinase